MERLSHTHSDDTSELLSAYSDNAVDVVERRRAEEYLARCAACVQELRELRLMHELLGELPYAQPPRSFTIDPATAPRPRWLLFPTLRLASLVATLLFVVVLGVDGLNVGVRSTSQNTSAAQSPAMGATSADQAQDSVLAPFASAAAEAEPVPEALRMASAAAAATGAGAADTAQAPEVAAQAPQTSTGADAVAAAEQANGGLQPSGAAGGAPSTRLKSNVPAPPDTTVLEDEATSAAPRGSSTFDTLRIIELALAVIALGFGVGAFVAWRRSL